MVVNIIWMMILSWISTPITTIIKNRVMYTRRRGYRIKNLLSKVLKQ